MKDARTGRHALLALVVLGLFRRKPTTATRLHVTVRGGPPPPPPEAPEPPLPPIKQDLKFQDLHQDVDPSPNVRARTMTCEDCSRTFRYFANPGGKPTVARCPGCGRHYGVS